MTMAIETRMISVRYSCQASEKPVNEAIVASVLSKQIDDQEPTLARHGYTPKILTELLGTKPAEILPCFGKPLNPSGHGRSRNRCLPPCLPR